HGRPDGVSATLLCCPARETRNPCRRDCGAWRAAGCLRVSRRSAPGGPARRAAGGGDTSGVSRKDPRGRRENWGHGARGSANGVGVNEQNARPRRKQGNLIPCLRRGLVEFWPLLLGQKVRCLLLEDQTCRRWMPTRSNRLYWYCSYPVRIAMGNLS